MCAGEAMCRRYSPWLGSVRPQGGQMRGSRSKNAASSSAGRPNTAERAVRGRASGERQAKLGLGKGVCGSSARRLASR